MNKSRVFSCDFETTVFKGQTYTEVWASASVELYTEEVNIFHSISEQFEYFKSLKCNVIAYYHNLKFDGSFWLAYLMQDLKFDVAQIGKKEDNTYQFKAKKDMYNNTFKYSISDMGQWYTITIKVNNHFIEIRDSLKLLPFSVKQIGESFGTKHKKLDMEYIGFRYAGCTISDEEKKYIANDVLVVKEALEIMYSDGHDKLTIGSCCLSEYKNIINHSLKVDMDYKELFPDMSDVIIDKSIYGVDNADAYIRRSYKGGWCYVVPEKRNKIYVNGVTADVNSLYPSVMHSRSGSLYPIGYPHFWSANQIPDDALKPERYYFVRVKTRFYLKPNKLPFIQIKGSWLYRHNECLETSDIKDIDGIYKPYCLDENGNVTDTRQILTLTMTDYILLKEHYDLVDFEILDGCWFYGKVGIFDEYIDKYAKIKMASKGAKRQSAKLFLNNLYGKMASSTNSSFKVAYEKEDGSIGFYTILENEKKAGYIPVGSAITSYARNFTIRVAQKNYYGKDKAGFIYADTDSIHCDLPTEELKGITVHPSDFCCWKLETSWDVGIFTRQKTYIEHVIAEDLEQIEKPFYNVKCAGMPEKCKNLFIMSMTQEFNEEELTQEELDFVKQKRGLEDFKVGLKVPSKLRPKRIRGGVLLVNTTYEMR